MNIKTSELTGAALDWAVLELENGEGAAWYIDSKGRFMEEHGDLSCVFEPHKNWAQGGPIIEKEQIDVWSHAGKEWAASVDKGRNEYRGPTPLIAAMRCFVASKLGDEVEIPDELAS